MLTLPASCWASSRSTPASLKKRQGASGGGAGGLIGDGAVGGEGGDGGVGGVVGGPGGGGNVGGTGGAEGGADGGGSAGAQEIVCLTHGDVGLWSVVTTPLRGIHEWTCPSLTPS